MTSDPSPRVDVTRQLGVLAMRFRRTRDETARRAIATEYAQEVQRLIETGDWSEAPAFEDQLPLEWMPEAFFAYWCPDGAPRSKARKESRSRRTRGAEAVGGQVRTTHAPNVGRTKEEQRGREPIARAILTKRFPTPF